MLVIYLLWSLFICHFSLFCTKWLKIWIAKKLDEKLCLERTSYLKTLTFWSNQLCYLCLFTFPFFLARSSLYFIAVWIFLPYLLAIQFFYTSRIHNKHNDRLMLSIPKTFFRFFFICVPFFICPLWCYILKKMTL